MIDIVMAGVYLTLFWGGPGSRPPAVQHLQVALVPAVPMAEAELETIRDQLTRIWGQEGIVIELTRSAQPAPGLRLALTSTRIQVTPPARDLCDLGVIRFVNGVPEPELRVSVPAAREFVRQARPEWSPALQTLVAARIAGRVAAHELGHYLLAESGHRRRGLMRARFDGADLLGPHLGAFAPPHRMDVEAGLIRAMTSSAR